MAVTGPTFGERLMDKSKDQKGFENRFAKVFLSELEYLEKRRGHLGLDSDPVHEEHNRLRELVDAPGAMDADPERVAPQTTIRPSAKGELVGLALSGGGVRSATFNLGVLQALARRGVLRCCDYLSTVSGGGYIGSCLSSLLDNPEASVDAERFPFRFQRKTRPDEQETVKHLREHGNFLAVKGTFLEYARMLGTFLTGLVLTNLFPAALLILFGWGVHTLIRIPGFTDHFIDWCFYVSLCSAFLMVVIRGYGATCSRKPDMQARNKSQTVIAALACVLVVSAGLGLVALLAHHWNSARDWVVHLLSGLSAASALGLISGLMQGRNNKGRATLGIVFRVGWVLVLPILFAWLLQGLAALEAYEGTALCVTLSVAAVLLAASLVIDTNRASLHHFYRDRLSEAYIIKNEKIRDASGEVVKETIVSNDPLCMHELHAHENGAPCHLINTTLNVPASTDPYLRGRGADLFFFSRNYVGSESTGYRKTEMYNRGRTRLATAMAISGAAASPQMGTSTNEGLRALLTLLNVRLNRWMPNPNPAFARTEQSVLWPWYFLKEIFGRATESDGLLNLSDGGHHENLGVYPLLKRRCRIIIASDAAADPDFSMVDLANVIRKARIDLGVNIVIQPELLRPEPQTGLSRTGCVFGKILYPSTDPDETEGTLIYIKSALIPNAAEDLRAYQRKNPSFPDQTTGDQFFDEAQFESYRKLGETIALEVFKQPLGDACLSKETVEKIREEFETG